MSDIRRLIANSETQAAIAELLRATEGAKLRDEAVQLSAQYQAHLKKGRLGIASAEAQRIELNQIHAAVLELANELDQPAGAGTPRKTPVVDKPPASRFAFSKIALWLGAGASLVAILAYFGLQPAIAAAESHSVTVLAHGKADKDELVLPNRGRVQLLYGDAKVTEQVNNEGEATFKQIPARFFEEDAFVELHFADPEGEPYRAVRPDSQYRLKPGAYIALEVALLGMNTLYGIVKDFSTGQPVEGATVRLFGQSVESNAFGEFFFDIPESKQTPYVTLRAYKEGYQPWELSKVPTTTEKEVVIGLKPQTSAQ